MLNRRRSPGAATGGPSRRGTGAGAPVGRPGEYRVPDDVAERLWAGHPWIFRDALRGRTTPEPNGTVVDVIAGNRQFVGRGYIDQDHAVAIRMLSRDADLAVHPGAGTIAARFARAHEMRWRLFGPNAPTAMRLFSGESEGLPGVSVDRYGDFVVVQWLSAGALLWRDELFDAIRTHARPSGIYEQKRIRPLGGQAPIEPAARADGDDAPLEVIVEESGCKFAVDVTAPLGVGFYPDLRMGRDLVAARAADRRVLNLFSYTGAFSVRAAHAGAAEVVAVDTVAKGHARARRNFELSGLDPNRMEQITGDAMKTLEKFASRGRKFDLVICDPPTFAHGQQGGATFSVAKDFGDLAAACLNVLDPGGTLAFSTNSTKLSVADVDRALAIGAAHAKADVLVVARSGLPPDYPVAPGFTEGNYLKLAIAVRH